MTSIGILGTGGIGLAIARKLIGAGTVPFGYRRADNSAFVEAGGRHCASAAELVDQSDIVLLCVPDAALESLFFGAGNVLAHVRAGQTFVDLGVAPIELKRKVRDRLSRASAIFLDAPVMGNPPLIEAGRAVVYMSGEEEACRVVEDELRKFAAARYVGKFGDGSKLKYVSNMLLAVHTVAAAEAVVYAKRSGLDIGTLLDHIPPIAQSGVLGMRGKTMASGAYGKGAGTVSMLLDVINVIHDDALASGIELTFLGSAKQYYERAVSEGLGDSDTESLVEVIS
jgi:putative dehydrogenase